MLVSLEVEQSLRYVGSQGERGHAENHDSVGSDVDEVGP